MLSPTLFAGNGSGVGSRAITIPEYIKFERIDRLGNISFRTLSNTNHEEYFNIQNEVELEASQPLVLDALEESFEVDGGWIAVPEGYDFYYGDALSD